MMSNVLILGSNALILVNAWELYTAAFNSLSSPSKITQTMLPMHIVWLLILYTSCILFYYRDLKCENLLLDVNNTIKISDFGFARRFELGEMCRTFCGSAAYAAPEILQGIPYEPTGYDVWSMGVILYIMVCEDNTELMRRFLCTYIQEFPWAA